MKSILLALVVSLSCFASNLVQSFPKVPKPPKEDLYVGCRPSVGECQNSCAQRNGRAEIIPQLCDPKSSWEKFACFCPVKP